MNYQPLRGANLTGNELYYDQPNGEGTSYSPGATISTTTRLYIYGYNGGGNAPYLCADEEDFLIIVNNSPTVTLQSERRFVCDNLDSITFTGSPVGGEYSGGSVNPVTGVLYPTGLASGDYRINYTYTDNNGCEGSDFCAHKQFIKHRIYLTFLTQVFAMLMNYQPLRV